MVKSLNRRLRAIGTALIGLLALLFVVGELVDSLQDSHGALTMLYGALLALVCAGLAAVAVRQVRRWFTRGTTPRAYDRPAGVTPDQRAEVERGIR